MNGMPMDMQMPGPGPQPYLNELNEVAQAINEVAYGPAGWGQPWPEAGPSPLEQVAAEAYEPWDTSPPADAHEPAEGQPIENNSPAMDAGPGSVSSPPSLDGVLAYQAQESVFHAPMPSDTNPAPPQMLEQIAEEKGFESQDAPEDTLIPGPQSPPVEPVDYEAEQAALQNDYWREARRRHLVNSDPDDTGEQMPWPGFRALPHNSEFLKLLRQYTRKPVARPVAPGPKLYSSTPGHYRLNRKYHR